VDLLIYCNNYNKQQDCRASAALDKKSRIPTRTRWLAEIVILCCVLITKQVASEYDKLKNVQNRRKLINITTCEQSHEI